LHVILAEAGNFEMGQGDAVRATLGVTKKKGTLSDEKPNAESNG
jgi:hypothetical protein